MIYCGVRIPSQPWPWFGWFLVLSVGQDSPWLDPQLLDETRKQPHGCCIPCALRQVVGVMIQKGLGVLLQQGGSRGQICTRKPITKSVILLWAKLQGFLLD